MMSYSDLPIISEKELDELLFVKCGDNYLCQIAKRETHLVYYPTIEYENLMISTFCDLVYNVIFLTVRSFDELKVIWKALQ